MKIICTFLLFIILFICLNQAVAENYKQTNGNISPEKDSNMKTQVAANNDFAFSLYSKLNNSQKASNLFFSPYSISTALAMVYAGAGGETKKQMAETLHFTLSNDNLHRIFGDLQRELIGGDKSDYQLLLANALWCQKGEPFLKEFLDLIQSYYGAAVKQLDFVKEAEQSRKTINLWVEGKTNNKIKDIIPSGGINEDVKIVLTNTIYFKGEWENKFAKEFTTLGEFNIDAKRTVKVNMMYMQGMNKFYEDDKLQVLELPYKEEISMLLILSRDIEGIKEIDNILSANILKTFENKLKKEEIEIYLPKFKITWGIFSLNKALIDLGMTDAFTPKADFSGINGKGDLWISDVYHKAFIEVNEEGTEAGAGTAAILVASISPVFRADHPFIFIIKDNRSGSILFIGRLMNPAE
ncbi:MAG: serpin family protein [Sedimentisphaerales bacterium]